jgi:hypothetical protein
MVSTLLVLGIAAVALALTGALLRGRGPEISTLEQWETRKNKVDIEVFRALLDPAEERYLQRSLSKIQFRGFLRKRIRLALRAAVLIGENAVMLTRLGQLATEASPGIAREAQALSAAAVRLRLNLILMQACLWVKWLFPALSVSVPAWEIRYNALLNHLVRVQDCAYREARLQG